MPKIPLKDPRYKPINKGNSRRYLDSVTGEVISRREFEKRTRGATPGTPAGQPGSPEKSKATPGITRAQPRIRVTGYKPAASGDVPEPENIASGPVPVVEAPEAPPSVKMAYDVTKEAAEVAHAASVGMERLATKIGHGIAQCASYAAEAFLPPSRAYLAPPEEALRQVTEPAARLFARHSRVKLDLGPDGDDIGDLFVGVMACVTAVSVQKIQYEQMRLQAIHEFEAKNGPGSYAAAVAASRGQAAQSAGENGQAQNGNGHQNGSGGSANGATTHSGSNRQGYAGVISITDQLVREHANGHSQRRDF